MTTLPGTRRLLATWLTLMGLTLVAMLSARLDQGGWEPLTLWSAGLVLAATGFKAQRLLMVYLNLRAATSAWKGTFVGLVILTLVLIGAGYAAPRLGVV